MRYLFTLLCLAALVACQSPPPKALPTPVQRYCALEIPGPLELWLQEVGASSLLTPDQAREQLQEFDRNSERPFSQLRYALLNQRLAEPSSWIRARDTLRELGQAEELSPELEPLVALLLQHSQAMINAQASHRQLLTELAKAQREETELAEKIQALTHLEENISQRRSQGDDTVAPER